MPRRSSGWIWAGRIVFIVLFAAVVVYLVLVGADKADRFAIGAGLVVALLALAAPYLLPVAGGAAPMPEPDRVEDTGNATATSGGHAITGADIIGDGYQHR